MKHLSKYILTLTVAMFLVMQSCQQPGGDVTGSEFMPDMAHSVAYEANYYNYYYNNTWGSEDEYYKYAMPKEPVNGTVPRRKADNIAIPQASDNMPYYYGDSDAERERAMTDITTNPFPITEEGLAMGKELYNINCAICHGEKGDGNGYLVRDDGGVYPVQPAILTNDEFVTASEGRYYHSIMYGKNLMGSYSDKLSYRERWEVIHYIRALQAKEKKLQYSHLVNTLNNVGVPGGEVAQVAEVEEDHHDDAHEGDHDHGDHSHDGHDHEHGDHHDNH